ncbi:unnamed protein product [Auanema sp. JU1783]|nr:unnamed protein product [Auanema sp. JU1783]
MSRSSSLGDDEKYEIVDNPKSTPEQSSPTSGKTTHAPPQPERAPATPSAPAPPTASPANPQTQFDLNFERGNEVLETMINIDDRDGYKINEPLKLSFAEIYAEPGADYHSIACVWTNSFRAFELTRIYTYKILTLILGIPIAFIFGLIFAFVTFMAIWIGRPLMRLTRMGLALVFQLTAMIAIYAVRPFFYAAGACFSTARLHISKGEPIKEPWYPEQSP